jgi:superfamily II DNA or RNA helicase
VGSLAKPTRQDEAFAAGVRAFESVGGGVLSIPPGYGKCLGKDTLVMMFDGSLRKVQDVRVGERIMGDDSTPRTILSTCSGLEQLYRVVPTKGESYVVNESHILSLKWSDSKSKRHGEVVDMSVTDYLKSSETARKNLKGYKVPVVFNHKDVPMDPYMLGYWLGDGASRASIISTQESTVLHYFNRNLKKYGLSLNYISQYDYRICGPNPNYFFQTLKNLNLICNKHIPDVYKFNSRHVQLQVLAGLLDSDGSIIKGGWDFCQKNERLFDDVMFLARSLGFACYKQKCEKTCTNAPGGPKTGTYFRCSIFGLGIEDVPCQVVRKRQEPREQRKNPLVTGIILEKLDVGEYFGFEIDGNRRFVLGDFTVTHNTVCALAFAAHLKVQTMVVVHKEFLANQWRDRIQSFCPGASIGRVQGDTFDVQGKDFVIAMIQTMCMREFPTDAFDSVGLLVVDEAHHIGAPAFSQFMFKICPKYTLGLTATPDRKDGLTRLLYWFLGPEFFRITRTAQKTTRVETLHYVDEAFQEAPPVTRFGKINMAGMISQLTEIEARNNLLLRTVNEALALQRRVLILSDRREHCFYLQSKLGDALSGLYIGGMKEAELAVSAEKRVVVATFQLAQEGLDIPVLDTVILATPKSDIVQSIGRIMRETKGKLNDPLIYDVADHWSVFHAMYRKRCKVYTAGGFQMGQGAPEPEPEVKPINHGKCMFT